MQNSARFDRSWRTQSRWFDRHDTASEARRAGTSFRNTAAMRTPPAIDMQRADTRALGGPRLSIRWRRVILVAPSASSSQVYVVCMGNGPCAVAITKRRPGSSSRTSYVYSNVRPRNWARNRTGDRRQRQKPRRATRDLDLGHHVNGHPGSLSRDCPSDVPDKCPPLRGFDGRGILSALVSREVWSACPRGTLPCT